MESLQQLAERVFEVWNSFVCKLDGISEFRMEYSAHNHVLSEKRIPKNKRII